jgi:hypothetical protein
MFHKLTQQIFPLDLQNSNYAYHRACDAEVQVNKYDAQRHKGK